MEEVIATPQIKFCRLGITSFISSLPIRSIGFLYLHIAMFKPKIFSNSFINSNSVYSM